MSVRVTRLAGGLTVATDSMDSLESVSVGAWVGVGTRQEAEAVNGVAHLLEHMVFKGTARRSARDIAEEIEAVGGHMNAYTGRETTAFYAKVLAEDLPLAVDVIADILQNSTFEEEELQRERAVVIQEIGQANDTPDDIVFDFFQEAAYPEQAMGRPVLGRAEVIARLSSDELRAYLGEHYSPQHMVVAAAGKIQHEAFVALVAEAFAALPGNGAAAPATAADYRGGDFRETRDLEQVHLLLGFESVSYHDPDYYPTLVLSTLLGGGMSSRLFQEVREKRGLVYSIYSYAATYSDGGLFGIYAGTGESEVEELIPVVADELNKVTQSVADEEVSRACAQLKASILMGRESSGARAEQLGQQILAYGRPLTVEEVVGKIEAVDGEAVRKVGRRLLTSRPTMVALGPVGRVEAYDSLTARFA